jgi:hypothetical protein
MTIGKKLVLAALLTAASGFSAAAQTGERSYYVSANGDDANNGRSEDAAFKTFAKAAEMANKGSVKTITILGTLNRETEGSMFTIVNNGTAEILIKGKSDGEKAFLQGDRNDSVLRITGTGPVRLENVEITGGRADNGSGIYISGSAVTLGKSVTIRGNTASGDGDGGGVYVGDGSLTMLEGAAISGNRAAGGGYNGRGDGGGVYIKNGTFTMSGGTISDNRAAGSGDFYGDGGGVYIEKGTFTMSGGTISGNTAKGSGGGVYIENGTFTMSGGTISGNTAAGYGGYGGYGYGGDGGGV